MNWLTCSKRMIKERSAKFLSGSEDLNIFDDNYGNECQKLCTKINEDLWKAFDKQAELAIEMSIRFKNKQRELAGKGTSDDTYMVTIRPNEKEIDFEEFYKVVSKYVHRKCWKRFKLSFEQKGTTEATLGNGFHVHIFGSVTQNNKGQLLRDTQSSFKNCCAPNGIKVHFCLDPDTHFQ